MHERRLLCGSCNIAAGFRIISSVWSDLPVVHSDFRSRGRGPRLGRLGCRADGQRPLGGGAVAVKGESATGMGTAVERYTEKASRCYQYNFTLR